MNPDETTFDYLRGRRFAPGAKQFDSAVEWWRSMASDAGASFDDEVTIDAAAIRPTVTWGINPGQSVYVDEALPRPADVPASERFAISEALEFMSLRGGEPIKGTRIDVAFVGSCTNARLSDLREAARMVRRPARRAARQGAGRAGIPVGAPGGGAGRAGSRVHRRRVRLARRRLLDVPGDEPGPAGRARDLRLLVEP